ncbi:MAG: thioredoxin domain-containing protein [Pirellulales bacterium]|nr:thioredoxin domain-containing protein [Pirellulales bacterium]
MPNRLADETSPYLLQHAGNPVDWYPWGPEALERSRQEQKPIFLSIGYSACHWCHVMEHESFENEAIAQLLNEHFVCIKVDREERPDLDQIYMQAVQLMTGRGGWPMSVFLTPSLEPFYGGTYWPPTPRHGMPGFDQVLQAVLDAWQNRREAALEQADQLTAGVRRAAQSMVPPGDAELSVARLRSAVAGMERGFDFAHGGFGGAPKFPHPTALRVMLRAYKREPREAVLEMVTRTLDRMADGGIHDQLGGGFHRYSVDERWLVPHFEKMLYDNAQLAVAYLEAFQVTGHERYASVVRSTLDYILREMTDPQGGFYSTQDADSEGVEGKFFVWTRGELNRVLGAERARTFAYVYDVSEEGNFEEANILNLPKSLEQCALILQRDLAELKAELAESRAQLFAVRAERVPPGLDDKVLVSWNGLAIDALARAGAVLDEPRYLDAARACASFILAQMRREDGRLLHSWRRGQAKIDAFLDDYAALAEALVSLYEATFDEVWITEAVSLAETIVQQFADGGGGGFFYTASDHERLIARPKEVLDSSVPSASGLAATVLLRLANITGNPNYATAAEGTLIASSGLFDRAPTAMGQMLLAMDAYLGPIYEIVVLGDPTQGPTAEALADLRGRYVPNRVLLCRSPNVPPAHRSPALGPIFEGKTLRDDEPAVFVCQGFECREPISGLTAARARWAQLAELGHG